jgi:hypothetical protein
MPTEYIRRCAGGFYIVDDDRPRVPLLTVRRAMHQVIDPQTDHPFPELSDGERYTRMLCGEPLNQNFSNHLPPNVELNAKSLEETLEFLRRGWENCR